MKVRHRETKKVYKWGTSKKIVSQSFALGILLYTD
jgi:hypothetical protein